MESMTTQVDAFAFGFDVIPPVVEPTVKLGFRYTQDYG